jgi:FAD-dependent urate hydroxylase
MGDSRIAIIGGGISGMSSAIALQRKGIHAEVYEKDKEFIGPDTGLVLSGNAVRAYYIMGLGAQLLEKGLAADRCTLKSDSGAVIAEFDYQAPSHIPNYLFIQRSVLYRILTDALLPGTLHLDKHLVDIKWDSSIQKLYFKDGTFTEADFIIGCDGAVSKIRSILMPNSKLDFSGFVCWRGLIKDPLINSNTYTETWGPRGRFGIAPMPDNQLYWYAFKKAETNKSDLSNWTPIDLLFNFFYYHDPIQEILENTTPENLIYDELYELKPLEHFHLGNILLIGDSAHASIPNIGQGASQAAEDAVFLAKWISTEDTIPNAFKMYERHRHERTKRVKNEMKMYGMAAQIDFPILCSIRNKLLQMAPASYHNEKLRKVIEIDGEFQNDTFGRSSQ